jgi:methyltransferase
MELLAMTPGRWAVLVVMGAIGTARLGELAVSAARLRSEFRAGTAQPVAEGAYPWIVAVHAAWFAGCVLEGWIGAAPLPAWALVAAGCAWGASLALRGWILATLGRLWNVRIVARRRQPVVAHGPYAWIRHPNYLAVILEIAAVPLLLGAVWTAVLGSAANGAMLVLRIRREEAYLFAQPGYRAAFGHKKRLVPGVF